MDVRILISVILLAAATAAAADPQPSGVTKKWSVSLHEAAFPEFSGIERPEVPQGSDGWTESWTLLTPHLGLGYSLNERWSVETAIQMGPKSSFNSTESGSDSFPQSEFKSSLASVVAAREFKLQDGWSWSPKFGLALSLLEYREDTDANRWKTRTEVAINPVVTLEVSKPITESWSFSADYTRYFTGEDEINNSVKFGVRFRF